MPKGIYQRKQRINIGDKFVDLEVLRKIEPDNHGHPQWECKCCCGKTHPVRAYNLYSNNTTNCGCKRPRTLKSMLFKGYQEIHGKFWYSIKKGALARNLDFTITIEQAWELFIKQDRKCALTGIPLRFGETVAKLCDGTASLDRIDSKKGYTIDNIQWIHKDVNYMKQDYDQEYFIELCALIVRKHNGYIV